MWTKMMHVVNGVCILFWTVTAAACSGKSTPVDPGPQPVAPATQQQCLAQAVFDDPAESPYCLPWEEGEAHEVSQSYCSPATWSHHTRHAYDFLMPLGTEVRAARAGLVVELREHWPDDDRTGGHENMVSLRHEDETISLYLHMKQDGIVVEMGDWVPKGELLGYSGSSGDTQGIPHLHFQVCLRSGMCSWKTGEYTVPVNFNNAEGAMDSRGGLAVGSSYAAGVCS
jgi:hypothetical protein